MREWNEATVLVVDDEPDLRELLMFEFEMLGCQVYQAGDGKQGLDVVQKHDVHIVVSDIRMPVSDGMELLRNLKSRDVFSPEIFFTTGFTEVSLADAMDLGVAAVFSKPFDRATMRQAVQKSLRSLEEKWDVVDGGAAERSSLPCVNLRFENTGAAARGGFRLGRGGVFLGSTDFALPGVGETVAFSVNLAEENITVEGCGRVRWVRAGADANGPRGMGVEFSEITRDAAPWVFKTIRDSSPRAFIPKA